MADDATENLLREVITHAQQVARNDIVSRALMYFLVRVANTWKSIRTLRSYSKDRDIFVVDAGTLLRAMYDAYYQAEYLVSKSDESSQRAQDYFDFEHVERNKFVTKILSANNFFANRLKASPKRQVGEQENKRRFENVKPRFVAKKNGNATRNHWYPGTLAEIAKSDEYDTLFASFNGCVHSSASALASGPFVTAENVLIFASTIAAKVARLNVDHNKTVLTLLHQKLLDVLCQMPSDRAK
jgi:hypothetical protein